MSGQVSGQMAEAVQHMLEHRIKSVAVDRTGWTDKQWIADAQRLMDDIDGSVQSLVNGHVLALLRHVDQVNALIAEYRSQREPFGNRLADALRDVTPTQDGAA